MGPECESRYVKSVNESNDENPDFTKLWFIALDFNPEFQTEN